MISTPQDSKSAPTTPGGSKKHARFDDAKLEEHYPLRRTTTAPSSLERLPTAFFAATETHDLTPFSAADSDDYLGSSDWSLHENVSNHTAGSLIAEIDDEDAPYEDADSVIESWPDATNDESGMSVHDHLIIDTYQGPSRVHTVATRDNGELALDAQPPLISIACPSTSAMAILTQRPTFGDIYRRSPIDGAITNINVLAKSSSSPNLTDTQAAFLDARSPYLTTQDVRSAGGHFQAL